MPSTNYNYTPATEEWAYRWSTCWRCGRRGVWPAELTIHHFVRGTSKRKNDLRTTTILCYDCHWREHNADALGLIRMLARKKIFDPANYDLVAVCRLRYRADTAITESEVQLEVEKLR